jgi:hypothetical protein
MPGDRSGRLKNKLIKDEGGAAHMESRASVQRGKGGIYTYAAPVHGGNGPCQPEQRARIHQQVEGLREGGQDAPGGTGSEALERQLTQL